VNRGHAYLLRVPPEAVGRPLAGYLAERYPHSTREDWSRRIAAGSVRLDGEPTSADAALFPGQTVSWRRPPWAEPEAPQGFAILHRDADLLAVAKPSGLPTLPGAGFLERTLLTQVRALHPEASPLHRLGRFTSGIVLFARTREAAAHLARQWASRTVVKLYRALAVGSPEEDTFAVAAPIGPVPHPSLGTVHGATPGGRASRSAVRVVERRDGAFLCDVRIETGRPHQVRIHLAAAGHPLVGDPLYGPGGVPLSGTRALPGDGGYLLHAAELRVRHPRTGQEVVLRCAAPPRLR
jgi:23S rRNA pseudouridine1911/1915/1917 synthase